MRTLGFKVAVIFLHAIAFLHNTANRAQTNIIEEKTPYKLNGTKKMNTKFRQRKLL